MLRLALIIGTALALVINSGVSAATTNFSQGTVDVTHPLAVFVHTADAAQLGAKVSWTKAACCANGHTDSLALTIALVDGPGDAFQEIDHAGENCSVGGGKPISCYVFGKGGMAPSGWYIVKVEQFDDTQSQSGVKLSVYGDVDQTAPGPACLYPPC